jgi:hypothetical protein
LVRWEGDDYPENESWERIHYGDNGPPANRSLHDGIMTLDGLASIEIVDAYQMHRPLDPELGEEFVAQWGLRVDEVGNPNYPYDPGLALYSNDARKVLLVFGVNEVHSILEQQNIPFQPGVFHAWELRSPDMRTYTLFADGSPIHTGTFSPPGSLPPEGSWGDLVYGSNSLSDWDYFRFGVVPEPSTFGLLAAIAASVAAKRMRRHSSFSSPQT